MSEVKHSRAPFGLHMTPSSHVISDDFGRALAIMPAAQPGRLPGEQLANAMLFRAAPQLLAAAKLGRAAIAQDRELTIESATVPKEGSLEPDLSTLDEDAHAIVAELDAQLAEIDAAILLAEGAP